MSYGDGGFYFLQPVNNGYGAIGASYGQSSEPMQHPDFTRSRNQSQAVVYSRGMPNGMPDGAEQLGPAPLTPAQQDRMKLLMKLDEMYMVLFKMRQEEKALTAMISALPADPAIQEARGAQLKNLSKVRGKILSIITELRAMHYKLGEVAKAEQLGFPTFAEFPPQTFSTNIPEPGFSPAESFDEDLADEMMDDAMEEELMYPDMGPELAPPPGQPSPGFYEENEKTIMLVAGVVGAYALLRMMK